MLLRFWGTRGSIPAPVRPDQVEQKIVAALEAAGREQINLFNPKVVREFAANLSFSGSTVGGNTTCVTIELEDDLIIFDAGSGIRELGDYLMDESNQQVKKFGFSRGKGHAYLFFTHTHWDHIADANALVEATGSPLYAHPLAEERLANPSSPFGELPVPVPPAQMSGPLTRRQ